MSRPNKRVAARVLSEIIGVAIVYYLSGKLGRTVAPPPGLATVFWPPSGIALAALLILGRRVWPGILLGAFLSNNWSGIEISHARAAILTLATGVGIDTGSLLQALLGAELVNRFVGTRNIFDRFNSAVTFVGIAMLMCLVSCTIGVTSLWLGGALPGPAFFGRWWNWWIGDTCGVLVVTPLILAWWPHRPWSKLGRSRWIEAILLIAGVTFFTAAIFVWWHPPGESRYPADLLLLPLVAWVAYRFTQREVTLVVLVMLAIALWGTVHGSGPYRGATPWSTLPVMQAFIGILSILSIGISAMITERKRAGEALEESEHWLRESQRISRIGSYVLDIRSGHWNSSEMLNEILGIDPGYPRSLEGWTALLHSDDRHLVLEHLRKDVIEQGRDFFREYRVVRPSDGEIRWVLCRGELSVDAKRMPVKLAGTILDITERRQIEAELLQAQKLESIGRLAGGVAHDFNNLLTVINGYGDLVLGQLPAHEELHRNVEEICKAGKRAAELTMQLLAFSRKQVLQPRVVSLNDLVRESDRMLRRLIGEHIELECVLDPSLRSVEADPGQLHQVIMNLAVNARDAMPDGGKLIIETANGDQTEAGADNQTDVVRYVSLTVRDTGRGMDPETIKHVFEPFFTTKGVGKGTGLGLATVYGIVRQSAGHISVSSDLGRGAAFTVRLPTAEGIAAADGSSEPVAKGTETVLLVEDQDDVRRLLVTILKNHGYRVLHAADGDEAIQMALECPLGIDLLVTDVVMPRMRGPDLAARLQALQTKMRVLYISGYTDLPTASQLADGGGVHYLQKPFAKDALIRAVREALQSV
jgi:PAS domain S-box-containing protein